MASVYRMPTKLTEIVARGLFRCVAQRDTSLDVLTGRGVTIVVCHLCLIVVVDVGFEADDMIFRKSLSIALEIWEVNAKTEMRSKDLQT